MRLFPCWCRVLPYPQYCRLPPTTAQTSQLPATVCWNSGVGLGRGPILVLLLACIATTGPICLPALVWPSTCPTACHAVWVWFYRAVFVFDGCPHLNITYPVPNLPSTFFLPYSYYYSSVCVRLCKPGHGDSDLVVSGLPKPKPPPSALFYAVPDEQHLLFKIKKRQDKQTF